MPAKKKFDALSPPPAAEERGGSEVLRAMVVDKQLFVTLRRSFDDPAAWGLVLVDIARHAARSYGAEKKMAAKDAYVLILKAFSAEVKKPTRLPKTTVRKQAG
jgi:hypothetical protein